MKQSFYVIISIFMSGLCWYLSNGLTGDFWYLLWLAPVPILFISLKANGRQAFIVSFLAYLIGRLSWFHYLVMVATLIPAIILTLVLSVIFALIITLSARIILKIHSWFSVFIFPVLFTTFEFLLIRFSPDGSAASIAYSQSNVLPLIQIASLSGILGITFIVTFIPSAIALSLYYHKQKYILQRIVACAVVLLVSVILYGFLRINHNAPVRNIKAGIVVLDEKYHDMSSLPDSARANLTAANYVKEISNLAEQGAKYVVLPERAINIHKESEKDIIHLFCYTAALKQVNLIIGYSNYKNEKAFNSALFIDKEGRVISDYNKVHLVTGLENQFTPGNKAAIIKTDELQSGTPICKDLDFPQTIRKYGSGKVAVLFVPAWDFEIDDWLHSRMAILRGVEFGFSEVRAARQGRLTISDCYGRVTYESFSSKGQQAILLGDVSVRNLNTFYSRSGDWFGIVNLVAAICFILFSLLKRKS
jgi:apolipoprotein N-acyltransferase